MFLLAFFLDDVHNWPRKRFGILTRHQLKFLPSKDTENKTKKLLVASSAPTPRVSFSLFSKGGPLGGGAGGDWVVTVKLTTIVHLMVI